MVSHKIKLVNSSKLVSSSTISLQPNTLWIIHHHNTLSISTLSMHICSIHLELNQATHNHNSHSHKEAIIRGLTRAWGNNNREVDKQHQLDPAPSFKVVIHELMRAALLVQLLRCPKSNFNKKILLTLQIGVRGVIAALTKAKRKKGVWIGERRKTFG